MTDKPPRSRPKAGARPTPAPPASAEPAAPRTPAEPAAPPTPAEPAAPPTPAEPAEALAALVAKLRSELTGVRTAMRNRAVIEQAKGVLVERLGITPDQGFDHLVRLSQRTNIKLIEIAAAIVGTTAPDPEAPDVVNLIDDELRQHIASTRARKEPRTQPAPAGGPGARRRSARPPEIEALQAQHQLLSARISTARSYDEIAEALGTVASGWPPPAFVTLTLLDPDGAQRMVGTHGVPGDVRSQWSRIPPDPGLPVVVAVRDRETVWLPDAATVARSFPIRAELPFPSAAVMAAPLLADGRVLGGLDMSWTEELEDGEELRRYLAAVVEPVARRVDALVGDEIADAWVRPPGEARAGGVPAQVWLPTVIDALHHPAALLSAVATDDGQIVDFRIEYANALARRLMLAARVDPDEATLLAMYPGLGSAILLPEFTRLLQDGQPRRLDGLRAAPHLDGVTARQTISMHAVRLWDRVFAVWRIYTDGDVMYDQLLQAERIARIGSFCWELRDLEPQVSPQLARMFHGDPAAADRARASAGADTIPIAELTEAVHPDDLLGLQEAVRRTLVEGKPLLAEFRGAGRVSGRRLRITAEPLFDDTGEVTAVRGTVQDVTEERAIQARLRLAEEALAAQRRHKADDRHAAEVLQQALLPTDLELGRVEGVEICGRCRSTDRVGTVDGDWYDATSLAGGASILVLGDVDDRGLSSMATAARLRYAIRAYAALDMPPGDILTAVNDMLCAMEVDHTACVVVARYEPASQQLRWAAAGQVAPVRFDPDGRGFVLSGPLGLPLGAVPDARYSDTTLTLTAGDRLLLYTGGPVNGGRRRGGLDAVRRAAEHIDLGDLDAVVAHLIDALGFADDEDVCAMLMRITG